MSNSHQGKENLNTGAGLVFRAGRVRPSQTFYTKMEGGWSDGGESDQARSTKHLRGGKTEKNIEDR